MLFQLATAGPESVTATPFVPQVVVSVGTTNTGSVGTTNMGSVGVTDIG
jgi:hypothetical protein